MVDADALGVLGAIALIALMAAGSRRRARSGSRRRMRFPDSMEIPHRKPPDVRDELVEELARLRAENRDMADILRLAFSTSAGERAAFERLRAERQAQARADRLRSDPHLTSALRVLGASVSDLERPEIMKDLYRRKAKVTHPDAGGSEADFRAVTEAWSYIKAMSS